MCFDVESADVFDLSTPRARKTHRCDACGKEIKPGQQYVRAWYVYDREASTYKECRRCNYLRQQIIQHERAAGCGPHESDPGYGGYALDEAICDYPEGVLSYDVPADFVCNRPLGEETFHVEPCEGQMSLF